MKELADRGHDVTFISSFPQKKPIKNLKDISVAGFVQMSTGEYTIILFQKFITTAVSRI